LPVPDAAPGSRGGCVNAKTPVTVTVAGEFAGVFRSEERLLAAVALQKIHRVDGNCVTADVVVVVHTILLLTSSCRHRCCGEVFTI
jgi:hypothetical protein